MKTALGSEPSLASALSRRRFLARSTLAAATPILGGLVLAPAASPRAAEVGANDRLRLGLIGYGGMGVGDLDTFFLNPEVDCAVICDVDEAHRAKGVAHVEKKRGKKPDAVNDFRRVLDREDVDAVLICTPDHWHALQTVLACQAGKDVYVEKPLATSIAEGRAMLEAAKRHNRIVQMGSQWRSSTHMREAADFAKSGKLGKVSLVRGWAYLDWLPSIGKPADGPPPSGVDYDLWLGPAPQRPFNPNRFHFNFRWFWDYAGGLMTDWGVHLINMLMMGMPGEWPKTVASSGGKFVLDDNSETPDSQVTVYEFPSFMLVWEHKAGLGLGLNGRPWGVSWSGTEGTVLMNDSGWELLVERRKAQLEPQKKSGSGDPRPAHVRNFLDCVKSRQQPVENLEVGHHLSTLAHLGNIAFRTGHKIAWDPVKEQVPGDPEADKLVGVPYRQPWKLPYYARG
jgi:predicted dehydrogenase